MNLHDLALSCTVLIDPVFPFISLGCKRDFPQGWGTFKINGSITNIYFWYKLSKRSTINCNIFVWLNNVVWYLIQSNPVWKPKMLLAKLVCLINGFLVRYKFRYSILFFVNFCTVYTPITERCNPNYSVFDHWPYWQDRLNSLCYLILS